MDNNENKPTYISTTNGENLILGMLAISNKMSGTLPDKKEFYDSLKDFDVEPTPEFISKVHGAFPTMDL